MRNKGIRTNLVFATNNMHKLEEIRQVASAHIHLLSLSDLGFTGEIPEEEGYNRRKCSSKSLVYL